jgi:outer membrane lipoprotein carrier protein
MKKLFLLTLLGLSFFASQAQVDQNAKKVLDGVNAKLKTLKGVTAGFTYASKDKNNKQTGKVNGTIAIKGQKYFIKQGSTEIYCNGEKVWNYNGEDEVTVSNVDNDSKALSPQKLLSDFYDKDFTYKLISSAGTYHQIQLIPIDKKKNYKQVDVYVDKKKNLITKATIIDKNNNTVEFSLLNINTAANLSDDKFVFDLKKHPGIDVINQ